MPHCGSSDCTDCDDEHGPPSEEPEPEDEDDDYGSSAGEPFPAENGASCKRLVGVEVEYNDRVNISRWQRTWRGGVHADGSCGWEAVTPPVGGRNIALCLEALSVALKDTGTACNESCGVHVHVDASDLTWDCMYRFLGVYALVEPILYLCAGQHRYNNRYSPACGFRYAMALASADRKGAILSVALSDIGASSGFRPSPKGGREEQRSNTDKKGQGRYKGINILPWLVGRRHMYDKGYYDLRGVFQPGKRKRAKRKDCTIEFRMHRNTLDAVRLTGWATLCRDLVQWASTATDAAMLSLPRSGLRALCEHIAPNSRAWILRRVREWRAVTTASKRGLSSATGQPMAPRRIKLIKGVYSCAA